MAGGPGHGIEPSERGGRMRASHADREYVIGTLKAAYVYGLLTKDEFDARVSSTLAARTYAELAPVTDDIPAGLPAAPPPSVREQVAVSAAPADRMARALDRAIVATALLAGLAFLSAYFAGNPAGVLLALGATASALASLFLTGTRVLGSRHGPGSGRQVAPPEAAKGLRAGPRLPSAIPASPSPQRSKPRRRSRTDAGENGLLRPQAAT